MERMRQFAVLGFLTLSLGFMILPLAYAECQIDCVGCRHNIRVVPVGSTEGDDPIVTSNPANLLIFHTGRGPVVNVWLLIIVNKPTYDALKEITVNGSTFMNKTDFKEVSTKKIPPSEANPATGYPGSFCKYDVSAIKDKLDVPKEGSVYYGVKFFLDRIRKTPTSFSLSIELDSAVSDLKGLILGLGRHDDIIRSEDVGIECYPTPCLKPFNECTPYSESTLVVPEPSTLIIAASPFGALGLLYAVKKRRR